MAIFYLRGGMLLKIKSLFLWLTTPFQKFLQQVGNQEALMTNEQVDRCLQLIQDGDILLSYESGRPTSIFIKGYYDHAALVTAKKTIMEAVGDYFVKDYRVKKNLGGVRQVDLEEWLFKKDSVCIIRPVYDSEKHKINHNKIASRSVFFYEGLGYDYNFKYGNETVYCSELVYASYKKNDLMFMYHIPENKEILPNDYYTACFESKRSDMFFQIIYEARNG